MRFKNCKEDGNSCVFRWHNDIFVETIIVIQWKSTGKLTKNRDISKVVDDKINTKSTAFIFINKNPVK